MLCITVSRKMNLWIQRTENNKQTAKKLVCPFIRGSWTGSGFLASSSRPIWEPRMLSTQSPFSTTRWMASNTSLHTWGLLSVGTGLSVFTVWNTLVKAWWITMNHIHIPGCQDRYITHLWLFVMWPFWNEQHFEIEILTCVYESS